MTEDKPKYLLLSERMGMSLEELEAKARLLIESVKEDDRRV